MQKLLSLPQNLVSVFHDITEYKSDSWFISSDPGVKIGSGGGTAWLLSEHKRQSANGNTLGEYIGSGKKIVIHAGGQSRRLPSYAPSGKVLAPIPVFRWSQGQRIDQNLLDLQIPLLEKIMGIAGPDQNVMIAAGDVLIEAQEIPYELPSADVVCFGIWVDPHLASNHGAFFAPRTRPEILDFMLQKPEHAVIEKLSASHLYLMDIGIWVLSDKAVELLMRKCGWKDSGFKDKTPSYYDLYTTFGTSLGEHPSAPDDEISKLTSAVVPMNRGEFYHYGTSSELITSTEKIQNRIQDQRSIWHNRVKQHPSLFMQNALADVQWNNTHHHIWIENSHVPSSWTLHADHIITGVPGNDWDLMLKAGICLDIVPVGDADYCIRTYGMEDHFSGKTGDSHTLWMGVPVSDWFKLKGITFDAADIPVETDIHMAALFPVVNNLNAIEPLLQWMVNGINATDQSALWLSSERLSAEEICSRANLRRLFGQRELFRQQNLRKLALNYKRSVFYQADLKYTAQIYSETGIELPDPLPETEPSLLRCRDHMFRSEVLKLNGLDGKSEESNAFRVLQDAITSTASKNAFPKINIFTDQIVWGRSPARLDLAGGWSDTPPFCMQNGGSVLNMAVELNDQPPIQIYIRLCAEKKITLRSIDNGVSEVISTFDELRNFQQMGSVFSIPKAALYLAGFHPDFCSVTYRKLKEQLEDFGGGFEISLLAAIPKGSGLGTSSILAATLLGTLSDFCSLNWDQRVICHRTLILEQLLTSGGGWQDQYGGILPGIKLLESEPGMQDKINVRWMPDRLFTQPEYKENWVLYYTGVTRMAKNILAEIVRGMFLNEGGRLQIINEIKQHAYHMAESIQQSDYTLAGRMIGHSWTLNNLLENGTNTTEIQYIADNIKDYTIGYKLLGAGGGGYMLIAAKDPEAAMNIRSILMAKPPNAKARFVNMTVSQKGFQVSRS